MDGFQVLVDHRSEKGMVICLVSKAVEMMTANAVEIGTATAKIECRLDHWLLFGEVERVRS